MTDLSFMLAERDNRGSWAAARAGVLAGFLALPMAADAQQPAFGEKLGITDQPRMTETFQARSGYEDLAPDRFGAPSSPHPSEMGLYLVLRMFRIVCLGLERGETLEAVTPVGFAAQNGTRYLLGPDAPKRGAKVVLSPTGYLYDDEDGGHPAITLAPGPGGMSCKLDWRIPEKLKPETQQRMAGLLEDWLPFELSLVPFDRPLMVFEPVLSHVSEWDRACLGKWCPLTAAYQLGHGWISIDTALNITEIGGERP